MKALIIGGQFFLTILYIGLFKSLIATINGKNEIETVVILGLLLLFLHTGIYFLTKDDTKTKEIIIKSHTHNNNYTIIALLALIISIIVLVIATII